MTANVGSVPTLDASHHLKTHHLDVPAAQLVGTPASATAAAVQALITAAINGLVAGAPGALNTLQELATAIGNDPTYAADLATQLAAKASSTALTAETTRALAAEAAITLTALGGITPAATDAKIAAQAASDMATFLTYDGTNVLKNGTVIPIGSGGGGSASDNGLGGITFSSGATDNGLGGIAA